MKKLAVMIGAFLFILLLAGCQSEKSSSSGDKGEDKKVKITATTGQVADIAKSIGGDKVTVEALMGPGVDPHLYQPSQGDIKKIQEADIILYNGLHLEGKMGDIFERIQKEKPVVPVGESIPKEKLIKSADDARIYDPHVWFDPELWVYAVKETKEELVKLDPSHKGEYEKNAEQYIEELNKVKKEAEEKFVEIPKERRVLVTAHDAFGYFGKAYSMDVMGLQGLSTDSEYGLKDVQNLVDTLVDKKIKAVFIESSVSKKSINAVVEGAKKAGHNIKIGGELYSDAMGEEGTEEGTYIGMYRHNIEQISKALK